MDVEPILAWVLVSAGRLRVLGKPRPNAVKFFSSIELITLLADPNWLDDATKTIIQHWRRKNTRRNGVGKHLSTVISQ
jgi:hypothetical protein